MGRRLIPPFRMRTKNGTSKKQRKEKGEEDSNHELRTPFATENASKPHKGKREDEGTIRGCCLAKLGWSPKRKNPPKKKKN